MFAIIVDIKQKLLNNCLWVCYVSCLVTRSALSAVNIANYCTKNACCIEW